MCLSLKENGNFTFTLQWHITAKCDQKCKHCYIYDSGTYNSELENELDFEQCLKVIDDFVYTLSTLKRRGTMVFGGGDPLLRSDFPDILKYASSKNISPIAVIGNSYHLNPETAGMLKDNGVSIYQISIDGMKNTHDFLRKTGSFDDALRGFKVLKEAGIITSLMFTVNKTNMHEIFDVIRLAVESGIDSFEFDRLVPFGRGKDFLNSMINPMDYREFLIKVNEEYAKYQRKGVNTHFGYKDNLWGLLMDDEMVNAAGIIPPGCELERGCLIGKAGLVILSDGNVMACRRLPIIVGKVPDSTITEILNKSEMLKFLKNASDNNTCPFSGEICWGCLAEKYCVSEGNFFACDPQCWKSKVFNTASKRCFV